MNITPPIDILDGQPAGDLLLVCSDGVAIRAHSQILMLASSVLRNALNTTLKVEGSSTSWRMVLSQLYPIHPRPELSYAAIRCMLKVANMYDMSLLQAHMLAFLFQRFPAELSAEPPSETYVMSWLAVADELQLEELREVCLRFVRDLAFNGRLEDTLLEGVVPAGCAESSSLRRVHSLRRMSRSSLGGDSGSSGGGGGISAGGSGTSSSLRIDPSSWHQDDRPVLHDSLRQLSRGTLEELLGSLAMACSLKYHNRSRAEVPPTQLQVASKAEALAR